VDTSDRVRVPEEDSSMGRKRPKYTAEFKAEAARLHREGGRSMKATARDIGPDGFNRDQIVKIGYFNRFYYV